MSLTVTQPLPVRPFGFGYGLKFAPSLRSNNGTNPPVDPLAAHIAAMQAIDPTGGYFLADPAHYHASLTQAGVFSDAFGGPRTYTAPNVQASPTAIQDGASGLWYAQADGGDDLTVGNAPQPVQTLVAVCRPSSPENFLQSLFGDTANSDLSFRRNSSQDDALRGWSNDNNNDFAPISNIRINGTQTSLSRSNRWVVISALATVPLIKTWGIFYPGSPGRSWHGGLAALRVVPTALSGSALTATEAEMARFFAALIATNP